MTEYWDFEIDIPSPLETEKVQFEALYRLCLKVCEGSWRRFVSIEATIDGKAIIVFCYRINDQWKLFKRMISLSPYPGPSGALAHTLMPFDQAEIDNAPVVGLGNDLAGDH